MHADTTKKGGGGALLDGQQSDPEERALDEDGKPLMTPCCIRKSNMGRAPTDRRSEPTMQREQCEQCEAYLS